VRYEHRDEVVFERLSSPPTASTDETVNVGMVLRSQREVSGKILVYHNDQLVDFGDGAGSGFPVVLNPGPNRFTRSIPLRAAGAHRFRAVFQADDPALDAITANNEGRSFTVVSGQGRILILTQGGGEDTQDNMESADTLRRALAREKLVADVRVVGSIPIDDQALMQYSLIILSNVPAGDFSDRDRQALAVYVRDLGGGLVMVGGDDSFGAGGWMSTPVEEVMPVSFDVKAKKQIPKGALVLVMHACEIPQGNYIGERAAVAAVKTLSSRDLIGVLSYQWRGANSGYWDVPLQDVGDKSRMINLVKKMAQGDAPDLDPMMRQGVKALIARNDAAAKHMIVISDFDPAPPRQDLINDMKKYKISCSTIAIGYGGHNIDEPKAKWIARSTGGKFYSTKDFSKIPQIFIKESRIVRRSLINEIPFTPRVSNASSTLIAGMTGEGFPKLGGYVLSTPKPLATMALARKSTDGLDPVLSHWQVGLGKAVAFTSGMWSRWGADWSRWPAFSKLWGQIARWASRQEASAAFDISTTVRGGKGKVRIDALDPDLQLSVTNIEAKLIGPDYDASSLQMTQVGPGQYEVEFDARDPGNYVVGLQYRTPAGDRKTFRSGLSVAFSPEFREMSANESLLAELAERSGGRVLDAAAAGKVFDRTSLRPAETRHAIWETLLRWMLLLFLLDVAVRRIAINPIEIGRKVRRRIAEMGGLRPAAESAAVLSTLKGTRERVRDDLPTPEKSQTGPTPSGGARYDVGIPDRAVTEQLSKALDGASELDAPVVARPSRKKPQASEADFTSRLLKAKRRARDDMKDDEGS